MFEKIDQYIDKCISISEKEKDFFHSLLELKTFKKKSFLLQAGDICDFEGYIVKGCVRVYYIDHNGFEVILNFGIEDWWISDNASFSKQTASSLFIEALEDTELLMISFKNKEKLFQKIPAFERMFRLMIQRAHETMMNRLISTMSVNAEERYMTFIKKYPSMPQRVPQHLIASYIGISPEFLSKIRAKMARK